MTTLRQYLQDSNKNPDLFFDEYGEIIKGWLRKERVRFKQATNSTQIDMAMQELLEEQE
jgi:hypothetical protein